MKESCTIQKVGPTHCAQHSKIVIIVSSICVSESCCRKVVGRWGVLRFALGSFCSCDQTGELPQKNLEQETGSTQRKYTYPWTERWWRWQLEIDDGCMNMRSVSRPSIRGAVSSVLSIWESATASLSPLLHSFVGFQRSERWRRPLSPAPCTARIRYPKILPCYYHVVLSKSKE